jgi:hypothetical protein
MAHIKGQLNRAQLENLSADPTLAADKPDGRVWKNTTDDKVKFADTSGAVHEVVTKDQTQTLTNKTLTSPVVNTPTGIVKGDVGLGNVDNTSDATKNAAVATLTNKSLDETTVKFVNSGDATKQLGFSLGGATTGKTLTIQSGHTANRIWTIPDGTDTFTGIGSVQTLTNKTLTAPTVDVATLDGQASSPASPSAGFYKLYVSDTTTKLTLKDSSGNETTVGSGAGVINAISTFDAESGTTGWATYADAAGTRPVDGTGGAPTVTWTRSTSGPLRGLGTFVLTKDAANRQGEGASYAFSIDAADKAKIMQISFDYIVGSGTFSAGSSSADSDVIVYIYDVTNSRVIEPSTFKLFSNSSTIADRFIANFQTSADSTSYRLIFHCASTSASAYTLKIDNIAVSPTTIAFGTPITDWSSYTPTFTGFGTVTNVNYWWRRVGSDMEIKGFHTNGTVAATAATFTLPNNAQVSTSILKNNTVGTQGSIVGEYGFDSNLNATGRLVTSPGTNANLIYFSGIFNGSTNNLTAANGNSVSANSVNGSVYACVPIQGWSSQVQMSDVSDQRIVSMRATGDPASATSGNPIIFPTVSWDTHAGYNATTGRYTVQTAGKYRMHGCMRPGATGVGLFLYKNAVSDVAVGFTTSGGDGVYSGSVDCVAGDIIDIRPNGTYDAGSGSTLNIEKIANPALISATEKVLARYTSTSATTVTTGNTTIVDFATKVTDTHAAVTTGASWKFTAPIAGSYRVTSRIVAGGTGTTGYLTLQIFKNGSLYSKGPAEIPANAGSQSVFVDDEVEMVAGDYIDIRMDNPTGANRATSTVAGEQYVVVQRIGL